MQAGIWRALLCPTRSYCGSLRFRYSIHTSSYFMLHRTPLACTLCCDPQHIGKQQLASHLEALVHINTAPNDKFNEQLKSTLYPPPQAFDTAPNDKFNEQLKSTLYLPGHRRRLLMSPLNFCMPTSTFTTRASMSSTDKGILSIYVRADIFSTKGKDLTILSK